MHEFTRASHLTLGLVIQARIIIGQKSLLLMRLAKLEVVCGHSQGGDGGNGRLKEWWRENGGKSVAWHRGPEQARIGT